MRETGGQETKTAAQSTKKRKDKLSIVNDPSDVAPRAAILRCRLRSADFESLQQTLSRSSPCNFFFSSCGMHANKFPMHRLFDRRKDFDWPSKFFRCRPIGLPRNQNWKVADPLQSLHAIPARVDCFTSHNAAVRTTPSHQIDRWRKEQRTKKKEIRRIENRITALRGWGQPADSRTTTCLGGEHAAATYAFYLHTADSNCAD